MNASFQHNRGLRRTTRARRSVSAAGGTRNGAGRLTDYGHVVSRRSCSRAADSSAAATMARCFMKEDWSSSGGSAVRSPLVCTCRSHAVQQGIGIHHPGRCR